VELLGYKAVPLREDHELILYRGHLKEVTAPSVLLLATVSPRPALETVEKLQHEYSFRNELDTTWAVRPMTLSQYNEQSVLIFEDPGGEPLNRLVDGPMETKVFLRLAVAIAHAVGQLHKRHVIHKDLKPSNIVVARESGRVWLTGFGIASRLVRERQPPEPPEFIAGTLAYMAPEQTGRMNRSIDSRSDLYALGVTLYEMLTGTLPFTASDPMRWVHCHIARPPVPPHERVESVPAGVSAIVMKLLAKTPEERYQTASGVESDLRRCLEEWQSHGRIDPFPLGAHDASDRLLIPEKLYGRKREVDALIAAFDRVATQGRPELVLVSGYSGVGKSSVVNELHKVLVPPRGLFAAGKFDQYKRDIPYATLAQAFQTLVRQILVKSEADVDQWRHALAETLGPNGQLIADLIPEVESIIGKQPPVPDLPPRDAQRRFQLVFRRFLGVFAKPEHPLALFLDDLQWLDAATLELLEHLITDPEVQHLLVVGAYRDNEVSPSHPLTQTLHAIRKVGTGMQEIVLAPLRVDDIDRLVADALHSERNASQPLAQLVHEKTSGNPFFAIQFLTALADEGLLSFDDVEARWSWDLSRIYAKGYTDNVADLMVGKLNRLPVETQSVLQQLACSGDSADFAMLKMIYQDSNKELERQLGEAVLAGLLLRSEDSYRFFHDRVQEAAYSLIPQQVRAETHLRIGRLLAERTPSHEREQSIFEIVNQFNRATHLITSNDERRRVAELNLIAARRAKRSIAYASALSYLATGRELLTEESWKADYELIFSLEDLTAECELLTADMESAEKRLSMLAEHANCAHDLAVVTRLQLTLYTTLDRLDRGVEICLEYLRRGGTDWSAHPTSDDIRREYDRIWSLFGDRQIEDLLIAPLVADPDILDLLEVLTEIVTPAVFFDQDLCALVICRMVNLSLEHGNSDAAGFAFVWFGIIAGPRFGNFEGAFRFAQLGYDLLEKRGLKRFEARTCLCFAVVVPWTKHARHSRDLVRRAFDAAYRMGDFTYAAYSFTQLIMNFLVVGDPLAEAQAEAEKGIEFAKRARVGLVVDIVRSDLQLIRTLRGLTNEFGSFNDQEFDEAEFERHLASNPALADPGFGYWTIKVQAQFFAGNYSSAVYASLKAQQLLWSAPSLLEPAAFRFYSALSHAAAWDSAATVEKQEHFEALAVHHKQLEIWAEHCPENFENRAALVGAEIARIEGRLVDAEDLYEKAIRSSHANGFIQNEAVAYEVAARFYAARGFDKFADTYLREARYCYLRWGAEGKVGQLDQLYPQLRKEEPTRGTTSTIVALAELLDLATVIDVSQAVSGEIVLEKLIERIMRAAIEHAGAERGLLILPRGNELQIHAEATTSGGDVTVHLQSAADSTAALPESVVRYVMRTQGTVILDDASSQDPFAADSYIAQRRVRSILCLPLINQTKLSGLLYLENNLAPRIFTHDRVTVLKVLASQAAISLENARLYHDLENREKKIQRLVDANILGITMWNVEGAIVASNEAFLRMVQYDREDVTSGRVRWRDMTPAEWRERTQRALATVMQTGTVQPFESELFRKDGTRVPVLVAAALFEEGGNEGVAFALDLSEQKRAEESLRRSKNYLAEAQRLTQTGSWASDGTTYEALYWSEEMFRIFGFDPQQGLPMRDQWLQRIHPEDRDRVKRQATDRMFLQKVHADVEYRIVLPDGTVKHIHGLAHPALGPNEEVIEVVGTVVDITEHKRAEAARDRLRQLEADIAHINRVSTMGELTASLAHEIKQPMGAAVTNAEACVRLLDRKQPDVPEAREAALEMVKDSRRAADIIDRVRLLYQKGSPQLEIIDVNELVREMVTVLHNEANRHSVVIRTDHPEGLPAVMADRVQVQQALMNLMLNGIEAMQDTGGELHIKSQLAEDGQVLISVTDTGVGLPTEKTDQIFNAFFTTKPHGTGLGLAITRSIVESHGGRIWATANSGQGTTFRFTLPQRRAARA
jgi:PAS domain S-box-containing protein